MHEYSRVCPTCGEGYNVPMCDLCHVATVAQQPSGVGEPREPKTARELAEALCDCADRTLNGRARELANELREELLEVCRDWTRAALAREVGEGLREGDEVLLRAKISYIRFAGTNPRCARDFKLMVKDGDEEHVLFVTAAALAAPAPKPAPPALPAKCFNCEQQEGLRLVSLCSDCFKELEATQ